MKKPEIGCDTLIKSTNLKKILFPFLFFFFTGNLCRASTHALNEVFARKEEEKNTGL